MMEKMVAPTWKRQNEPFTIEVFRPLDQRSAGAPAS